VYTVQTQQNHQSFAIVLLLPLLILYWLGIYDIIAFSRLGSYVLFALFFGLLVYSFATQVIKSEGITKNVIVATLCLYLIIGLFWGTLYTLLFELSPGSYAGTLLENHPDNVLTVFNYFSMVTLTTLGYGDITPQTPGAAALCQLEAIVGQFYTAVVVAWLVGNFVSDRKRMKEL
jgi:voltage-gated potassium channel